MDFVVDGSEIQKDIQNTFSTLYQGKAPLRTINENMFNFHYTLLVYHLRSLSEKWLGTERFEKSQQWINTNACELSCDAVGLNYSAVRKRVNSSIKSIGFFMLQLPHSKGANYPVLHSVIGNMR